MNHVTTSRNVRTGSIPVNHVSEESPRKKTRFCGWCVKIHKCIKSLKKSLYHWWTKTKQDTRAQRMYKETLDAYKVSHVLEKTAGEDNLLAKGGQGQVARYRITTEDTSKSNTRTPVYSTNNNKGMNPVSYYETPALREQEIAYKTVLPNTANSKLKKKDQIMEKMQYQRMMERKAMDALDHPNIIKPAIIEGDTGQATTMTVIETRSLSEEEKRALATKPAGNDSSQEDTQIDPDFEVVESIRTEPVGIPLPLMETTLATRIKTGLSPREKDDVARALIGAVSHTHQRGYAHLDIKPSNVLNKGDEWLLADWGSACHYSDTLEGSMDFMPVFIPRTQRYFCGTINYLSPQMYGRLRVGSSTPELIDTLMPILTRRNTGHPSLETDARAADAYALGIVLCEVFTGERPVSPKTDTELERVKVKYFSNYFQARVDAFLQKHRDKLGGFNTIIKGLLQSKWTERMTVSTAQGLLDQIPVPQ